MERERHVDLAQSTQGVTIAIETLHTVQDPKGIVSVAERTATHAADPYETSVRARIVGDFLDVGWIGRHQSAVSNTGAASSARADRLIDREVDLRPLSTCPSAIQLRIGVD